VKCEYWCGGVNVTTLPDVAVIEYEQYYSHTQQVPRNRKLGTEWYIHGNDLYVATYKEHNDKQGFWTMKKIFENADNLVEMNTCV